MFVEIELNMANESEIYNTTSINPTSGGLTNGSEAQMPVAEPQALRVIRILLYVVIFFIGTIGNVLVLLVVYKTPSLRSGRREMFCINTEPERKWNWHI
jgi:hypothetical protein